MGNELSVPQPGTTLRSALSVLLNGPVYHGGTQITRGAPSTIRTCIDLLRRYPAKTQSDRTLVLSTLRRELDGFVATTDAPPAYLVPELLEVYPDAVVICTVRDVAAWERSIAGVASLSTLWFLRVVLFPLATMRHFVDYIDCLRDTTVGLYGEKEPLTRITWERHIARLKEVVPPEKLVFYDVRDGWEPLCRVLGKDVPDLPFPRINDGEAIERLSKEMIVKGLFRWLVFVITVGVVTVAWKLRG